MKFRNLTHTGYSCCIHDCLTVELSDYKAVGTAIGAHFWGGGVVVVRVVQQLTLLSFKFLVPVLIPEML